MAEQSCAPAASCAPALQGSKSDGIQWLGLPVSQSYVVDVPWRMQLVGLALLMRLERVGFIKRPVFEQKRMTEIEGIVESSWWLLG